MGNCHSVKSNATKLGPNSESFNNRCDVTISQHTDHEKDLVYPAHLNANVDLNGKDTLQPFFEQEKTNTYKDPSPPGSDLIEPVHGNGGELRPLGVTKNRSLVCNGFVKREGSPGVCRSVRICHENFKARNSTRCFGNRARGIKSPIPSTPTQRAFVRLISENPASADILSPHDSDNDLVLICLDCGMTIDEESVGIVCPLTAKLHA
ncbi:unnamed protein product [Phytomonas sp. Hart1]|nr:unnamed protein product [Phytomonas sp. Hart1]|eukprot:CCW70570.1 unnamed protein product [Phytomonas sp. isolate Hart1]